MKLIKYSEQVYLSTFEHKNCFFFVILFRKIKILIQKIYLLCYLLFLKWLLKSTQKYFFSTSLSLEWPHVHVVICFIYKCFLHSSAFFLWWCVTQAFSLLFPHFLLCLRVKNCLFISTYLGKACYWSWT